MIFNQAEFTIRCEWGEAGVSELAPISDVVVIVDVLSFSTCVDIAVSRGAAVFPYAWRDARAAEYARAVGAELAGSRRSDSAYSLSPRSLLCLPPGARLVLPSPNGAALSVRTGETPTVCGCLRNSAAVAAGCLKLGRRIAVIPAGERWKDGSLRPGLEDWLGAGAIISHLEGSLSPEARAALAVYREAQGEIPEIIRQCSSGKELIERGFEEDVALACALEASNCVPFLKDGAYSSFSAE
jgi:2-phosphosulfolactate phosphatase